MSYQERQHMKSIDAMILEATPERLAEIQQLDLQTQLDGKSFYDNCIESKIPALTKITKKSKL